MKISIIIPVYNVSKYINKCLDSIINQTYTNLEILIIDDGSTDNSLDICNSYAKKDHRIKVIHQKNSGVSKARNIGLSFITGDYVMFIDADDWLELDACFLLIKEIISKKKDIIIYNFYKEYLNNTIKNDNYNEKIKTKNDIYKLQATILSSSMNLFDTSIKGMGFTWNKIIKVEFIRKNNIKFLLERKKAVFEDVLFYYQLLENTNKVGFYNKYLYHYRILNTSATRGYNNQIMEINNEIFNTISLYQKKHKNDLYYYDSFYVRIINNLCFSFNIYLCNDNNKLSFKEKRNLIKNILTQKYYKNAVKNVKFKYLTPKLKIYVMLIKTKQILLLIMLNKIEKRIKEKSYNK